MKKRLLALFFSIVFVFCACSLSVGCDNNEQSANLTDQTTDISPSNNDQPTTNPPVDNPSGNDQPTTNPPVDNPPDNDPSVLDVSIDIAKTYLNTLIQSFNPMPTEYIPAAMLDDYTPNLITESEINYDFSNFVNVCQIKYGGFGKQWNMVIDNIRQSQYFYKYLNVGSGIVSAAIETINEYFNSANITTINKRFEKNNFSVEIAYKNKTFSCQIEYKTSLDNALFGNVCPKLSMTYNTTSQKSVYDIMFTSTNRMRYEISANKYVFGIEYGISTGSRSSYLSIEKKNNKVEGHIYEYITLKGKDVLPSCADFYIENGYVSVVGNKADAMMVSKGYINELYKANEGKLLGYEVRETVSKITYNTLWFNLSDISGINSIKIGEKTNQNNSDKSTNDVYLNGNNVLFSPTYNKKLGVKTSRKYDIEFRTQYFYSKNANGKIVEHAVKVPMMFIQENNDKDTNFSDYTSDIQKDNGITSSVILNQAILNKILADYDNLIDDFINNKKQMSSNEIKSFIES